jgi:hypothetical protein
MKTVCYSETQKQSVHCEETQKMDIIWKHFCSSLFPLQSCPHSLTGKRVTGLPFPTGFLNAFVPALPSLYLHHPSMACSVPWFLPSVPCISTIFYHIAYNFTGGHDNVVSIATRYRLDGPGIESRWGRDFLHLSRPALDPTQPPV